jgi:hypothetical protein
LGRFDRQQTEERDLPLNLDRATEEFRASLDRYVAVAETCAAEVEREADRYAAERRHQSEVNAQQMLEGALARASRVLDSIGLVESALSGMLDTLRAEFSELAPSSELPAPPPIAPRAPLLPHSPQPTATAERPGKNLKPAQSAEPSVELDHLIRSQVKEMVANGKPRVEVERFIARFPVGDNYVGMLDHLYRTPIDGPPRRRSLVGLWRRPR